MVDKEYFLFKCLFRIVINHQPKKLVIRILYKFCLAAKAKEVF